MAINFQLDCISYQKYRNALNYENDLKNEVASSFEAFNPHFDNLIASHISILDNHTTLKDPFQSLRNAECRAVWKKGRKHFDTQFFVDNPKDRNLKLS